MSFKKYSLPEYPVKRDMWDIIAEEKLPILVYGMGNGADKLFLRLEKYGVKVSDVFASDGFVRGHSFRGYKVMSFSEVKEKYSDFIILLSFASNRSEVIELVSKINKEHRLFVPDMPVAGEEYFDKEFYNANYSSIVKAYNSLADEDSKNAFAAIVRYKLFGGLDELLGCYCSTEEIYGLIGSEIKVAIDGGAYNGDTVRELLSKRPKTERIYAIEPDRRNFKKLSKYVYENGLSSIVEPINAALYDSDGETVFLGAGNRNSSISSTASHEKREEAVALIRVDSIACEKVDYIKYDVEGAELSALCGSKNKIERDRPYLLISAYHRSEDIFSLINYFADNHKSYSLYLRRTLCFPAWETAIIAVPQK